ncbi:MAG: DUF5107 domain-containing protein [Clostridia bacterium]|nr:DUF5107 domain-containing protein [Clostridia bacterium]
MKKSKNFEKTAIPTYEIGESEPLPIFFEKRANQGASSKFYPMSYTDKITDKKTDKEYKSVVLENEYVKAVALPELGGKVHSVYDKIANYDIVYHNHVIKPAMIAIAGPWISGGIEFNWPLHHRPTTYMPMDAVIEESEEGKTVWMGELEPYNKTKGMVGICVDKGRTYLKAKIKLFNTTPVAQPFLWWANTAVQLSDGYQIVFPPDVEHVHYHDRKGTLAWPIAKGVYNADRQYDFGDGVDLSEHRNIVAPGSFMVPKGESDGDFVGGYDKEAECGVVTVANHYISPGKKLWTWANNAFGYKWCENLTDDGSHYAELMSGCYTDNQPDFSYIAPYEVKEFEQYWYGVRGIGRVKSATIDGALNLEEREGKTFLGLCMTGKFEKCKITVKNAAGETVFEDTATLIPETSYIKELDVPFAVGMSVCVKASSGKTLVSYKVKERGKKEAIPAREASPRPQDIATVEELYLHGKHIVQYKHFAYEPDGYFLEGLRRDPDDSRCNEAMGDLLLSRGQFKEALAHFERAEKRLELRNANPENTDVLYKKALAERWLGLDEAAYRDFYWSSWSHANKSAAFYALAGISSKKGDKETAVSELLTCLETNTKNLWAKYMLFELTGDKKWYEEIESEDALFNEYKEKEAQAVSFANELIRFGLYERAFEILENAESTVKTEYYKAYLYHILGNGEKAKAAIEKGDNYSWEHNNFNLLEDIAVLEFVGTPMAHYYLGSLYYDKTVYEVAASYWEKCLEKIEFAPAMRCLAIAYYDHVGKGEKSEKLLRRAFELMPESDRILYECVQLNKALNKPIAERRAFIEAHMSVAVKRDDCILEYAQLLFAMNEYEEAKKQIFEHRFHTYEGGEGNLTSYHAWLHKFIADGLTKAGRYEEAEKTYLDGLVFPKSYGEEKSVYVNDAPVYHGLVKLCALTGKDSSEYLQAGCHTLGAPSVQSYYQILNLRIAGRNQEADELTEKLFAIADNQWENRDLPSYFGVGAPVYMPFMYEIVKFNTIKSLQTRGFAHLAKGETENAKECLEKLNGLNQGDFVTVLLGKAIDEIS